MKRIFLAVAVLLSSSFVPMLHAGDALYDVHFDSVYPNPFSVRDGDKDVLYSVTLNGIGSSAVASQLTVIAKYLGGQKPEDLEGKTFKSHLRDSFSALDLLYFVAKNNGHYKPPTPEEYVDTLVTGIAKIETTGECPNVYEQADSESIYEGMQSLFDAGCSHMSPAKLQAFQARITLASHGTLSVTEALSKEVDGVASMCGGEYLMLNKGSQPIAKFMLGAASNGFICTTKPAALVDRAPAK